MNYVIKCENMNELKGMLNIGKAGLPYVSDWAILNLEKRDVFPVFVDACHDDKFGMILNDINEDGPTDEHCHIVTYHEFVDKAKGIE